MMQDFGDSAAERPIAGPTEMLPGLLCPTCAAADIRRDNKTRDATTASRSRILRRKITDVPSNSMNSMTHGDTSVRQYIVSFCALRFLLGESHPTR